MIDLTISPSDMRAGSNVVLVLAHLSLVWIYMKIVFSEGRRNGWWHQAMGVAQVSAGYVIHRGWWTPFSFLSADGHPRAEWFLDHSLPIIELATVLVLSGVVFHGHGYIKARLSIIRLQRIWYPAGLSVWLAVWALFASVSALVSSSALVAG